MVGVGIEELLEASMIDLWAGLFYQYWVLESMCLFEPALPVSF